MNKLIGYGISLISLSKTYCNLYHTKADDGFLILLSHDSHHCVEGKYKQKLQTILDLIDWVECLAIA